MGKRSKQKQREASEPKPADVGLHKKTLNHSREGIQKPILHCLLIALVALLAYSNTFQSPFQWDEEDFIVQNPIVRDLEYFASPSKAKGIDPDYEIFLRTRYVGYLTFAVNYQIHGFDVLGYHIVNVIIHILNAVLVYLLVQLTFKTPFLKEDNPPKSLRPDRPFLSPSFRLPSRSNRSSHLHLSETCLLRDPFLHRITRLLHPMAFKRGSERSIEMETIQCLWPLSSFLCSCDENQGECLHPAHHPSSL